MQDREHKYGLRRLVHLIKERFDLSEDKATQREVIELVGKGVEFRGTNLWVLIFATFIASLGLNLNSTAVIIGAMLISPLMGPIMGLGLSVGVNDFELMKRSLRNFGFMVLVSIATSTIYFYLSPISSAQSELLARTEPTVYDVLIALFGGLAGFVAQTRKDRTSTVIPGVAIATALMPPLCTAGYGLATLQFTYFLGAAYLFFINTIFIAVGTYVMTRFMKYSRKEFIDKAREKKVKSYIAIIVVLTIIPSVIMTFHIVQRSIFDNAADRFVANVFRFEKTQVIDYKREFKSRGGKSHIDVVLIGESLSQDIIDNARAQMHVYGLVDTELNVKQADGSEKVDVNILSMSYTQLLDEKNKQIHELEDRLSRFTSDTLALSDIALEAATVVDNINTISLSPQEVYDTAGKAVDNILVCVVKPAIPFEGVDVAKLQNWLRVRTKSENVRIYIE